MAKNILDSNLGKKDSETVPTDEEIDSLAEVLWMKTSEDIEVAGDKNFETVPTDEEIDLISDAFDEVTKNSETEQLFKILKNDLTIAWLVENLWYKESLEMLKLRYEIIELMNKWSDFKNKLMAYEDLAMKVIENKNWSDYMKWQIILILLKANIAYEWNYIEYYQDNMKDASEYAYQAWFDDIDSVINKILKQLPNKK